MTTVSQNGPWDRAGDFRHDSPRNKQGRLIFLAAALGLVVLAAAGLFVATRFLLPQQGAASPQEVVDELVDAINDDDFVGVALLMDPGERRTLLEPVNDEILPELFRLEILEDVDIDSFGVQLDEVSYTIDEVPGHGDLRHVYFTGGDLISTNDENDIPWGDTARELFDFGESIDDAPPGLDVGVDVDDSPASLAEVDVPLALVERDGRWYFSFWFSVAESARLDSGLDLPAYDERVLPVGSDSPEAAAEAFLTDVFDLNLAGALSHLDPDEMAALHRYSPLFLQDAQDGLDEIRAELSEVLGETFDNDELTVTVDNVVFGSSGDGDDARVSLEGIDVSMAVSDLRFDMTWQDGKATMTLVGEHRGESFDLQADLTAERVVMTGEIDGTVVDSVLTIDYDQQRLELKSKVTEPNRGTDTAEVELDLSDPDCSFYRVTRVDETESGCLQDEGVCLPAGLFLTRPQSPALLSAHQTDGAWYVSPTSSYLDPILDWLRMVDAEILLASFDTDSSTLSDSSCDPFAMAGGSMFDTLDDASRSHASSF